MLQLQRGLLQWSLGPETWRLLDQQRRGRLVESRVTQRAGRSCRSTVQQAASALTGSEVGEFSREGSRQFQAQGRGGSGGGAAGACTGVVEELVSSERQAQDGSGNDLTMPREQSHP